MHCQSFFERVKNLNGVRGRSESTVNRERVAKKLHELQHWNDETSPWAKSKIVTSFSKSSGPKFDRLDGSRMIKEKVLEG